MIKLLEFFGGIGAPRSAANNLAWDYKVIDYVEINQKPVTIYNALYDNCFKTSDITKWDLHADILVHGSPCQDFSRSGKRWGGEEDKTRSGLLHATTKAIEKLGAWKPRFVVWENVRGVLDKDMKPAFDRYISDMRELGYVTSFKLLNAMDFGIPQNRQRVIAVSHIGKSVFNFDNLETTPAPHIREFLEVDVTTEQHFITIPSMLRRIEEFATEKSNYRFLDVIDSHCNTITTRQDRCPNAGIIKMPDGRYRYLTERECWLLMGYKNDDFDKALAAFPTKEGKRNATLYELAGNSIVVPMLEAVFKEIIRMEG